MSTDQSKKSPVPKQQKGAKSDTSHSIKLKNLKDAEAFFNVAKNRLLDVSNWYKLCGLGSATFALTDSRGNKVRRSARQGDHLRIDIPAPDSKTGDGYDWVRVEAIENKKNLVHGYEELSMRTRPAKNPKNNSEETAHFFQNEATSTFMIVREKNIVKAEIHGRNELPNVHEETRLDTLRNAVMALGAMLGFSKFQWKKLVKGLVSRKELTDH
ncbi:MAG: hypothetical protein ACR2FN_10935 [Chitinophagaceae bacterium]